MADSFDHVAGRSAGLGAGGVRLDLLPDLGAARVPRGARGGVRVSRAHDRGRIAIVNLAGCVLFGSRRSPAMVPSTGSCSRLRRRTSLIARGALLPDRGADAVADSRDAERLGRTRPRSARRRASEAIGRRSPAPGGHRVGGVAIYALLSTPRPAGSGSPTASGGRRSPGARAFGVVVVSVLHGRDNLGLDRHGSDQLIGGGAAALLQPPKDPDGRVPRGRERSESPTRTGRRRVPVGPSVATSGAARRDTSRALTCSTSTRSPPVTRSSSSEWSTSSPSTRSGSRSRPPLVISVRRPDAARRALQRIADWMRRPSVRCWSRAFAVVGAYFTIKGVLDLSD